jgi:hypothetical protein
MWPAALLALVASCGDTGRASRPFSDAIGTVHDGAQFVVVGDFQRTAPILEFWREQNDAERARIVSAIANLHPDLLAMTGDCVFDGGSDAEWSAFDALVAPLHAEGLPAFAAFGNHEYWRGGRAAEARVFPRFPLDAGRHWFSIAFGPLRFVVLDGNADHLSGDQWRSQIEWYLGALRELDLEPSVRGIFVLVHQPPYTNGIVTTDDMDVQRAFVQPFLESRKTLGMLSGHVHSYERFVQGGKTFVVSGGGGGPRAEVATGSARRHTRDEFDGPALREFNFTVYSVNPWGIDARVMGLGKGGSEVHVMDLFSMRWPT